MIEKKLIDAAQHAQKQAYAKYSNFQVGAAVETKDGKIYEGCNIENASFSLTICAERTALFSAIAAGERNFSQLVVATDNGISPFGAGRQVIWELCGDIPIIIVDKDGNTKETSASALLPSAFNEKDLKI